MRYAHLSGAGMRTTFIFTLALAAALAGPLPAGHAGPVPEAADKALGPAWMSALVDTDGRLIHGAGAVSSIHDGVSGSYKVTFARSLEGCTGSVTPWFENTFAASRLGLNRDATAVVLIQSSSGTLRQGPFQMLVFCHR